MFMYSKTYNRKFTTVVVGRKVVFVLTAVILVFISILSLPMVFGRGVGENLSSFHRRMLFDAVPVVSCRDDITLLGDIAYSIELISGLDINDVVTNFEVLPVFCRLEQFEVDEEKTAFEEEMALPVVKVSQGKNTDDNLKIKNETPYSIDTEALLRRPLDISVSKDEPAVLIVHTHGTESYTQSPQYHYSDTDSPRCKDTRYNVVRVGEELARELTSKGYNVIHDKSLNDTPSYNNSYNKTLAVIEGYLEKYPSIKCVFDVHRDAIEQEDGTKVKFTADINGEVVSQVMMVCGSDAMGLDNPNWQINLSFALKIQDYLNGKYSGLMRPVNLRKERFNLHDTTGSLILEFGTHGNTLDEALASVKYIAEGIDAVLSK